MIKNKGRWVLIAIGLIIAATSIPSIIQTLNYLGTSKYATGTVVRTTDDDYHNSHYSIPIIDFTTADGQVSEFKAGTEYSPQKYFLGDRVNVIYNPSNPAKADIYSPVDIWLDAGVMIIFGLFFVIIGIFSKL